MASGGVAMAHPREWGTAAGTVDYGAECRQVDEMGGDCFDFEPLADRRLALAVGDASGKGFAAAPMISNVQSSLRTAALSAGDGGASMVRAVNRHVYATSLPNRYATLFYGVLDEAARTVRYVNAGHTPPIVMRRDGSVDLLDTGGAPVGVFPDWPYEEGAVQLEAGDVVVAYTDGVVEAESPSGEVWGVEGLRRAAPESRALGANGMVRAIFRAMDEFTEGRQADDATVAVLQVR
jgi:sigma-B regulation protein RsbU (phosphoserine phosphatase)